MRPTAPAEMWPAELDLDGVEPVDEEVPVGLLEPDELGAEPAPEPADVAGGEEPPVAGAVEPLPPPPVLISSTEVFSQFRFEPAAMLNGAVCPVTPVLSFRFAMSCVLAWRSTSQVKEVPESCPKSLRVVPPVVGPWFKVKKKGPVPPLHVKAVG